MRFPDQVVTLLSNLQEAFPMRWTESTSRGVWRLALPCAILLGGCAPKPLHPASSGRGVKTINVFYDEPSKGPCVAVHTSGPQTLTQADKDALRVMIHNMCEGVATVRMKAAGVPLRCTPDLGLTLSITSQQDVYCSVRYTSEHRQYVIKATVTGPARASELALDTVP